MKRLLRLAILLLASVALLCSCSNSEPQTIGDEFEKKNSQTQKTFREMLLQEGVPANGTTGERNSKKDAQVGVENQGTDGDTFECMYFGDIPVGLLTTPDATTKEVEYFINQRFGTDRAFKIHHLDSTFQKYQIEVDDLFSFYGCKGRAVFCFDWNETLSTITLEFYDDSGITPEIVQTLHSDLEEMLGLKSGWTLDEEPGWGVTTWCVWNSKKDGTPFDVKLSSYFSAKYPTMSDLEFERTVVGAAMQFTNKYGTRDTLCAHSGCTNYIASSGDTNCCTVHSSKCYECGCYIAEDAIWCVDCLASTAERSFTNKYGTRGTICAHSGCTNYIAPSGNTNCCTTHSNRCYECGCYIDEDASWCVDCLAKAAKQAQQNKAHYCEECGSTADYSIIRITGNREYYCYKHYKEMQKLMKGLLEN